jgi:hypothetical protein
MLLWLALFDGMLAGINLLTVQSKFEEGAMKPCSCT